MTAKILQILSTWKDRNQNCIYKYINKIRAVGKLCADKSGKHLKNK